MVYIVTHSKFASHIGPAAAKKFIEMFQKFPPDSSLGERIIPSAVKRTDSGIVTFAVTEVKEGKFQEAWTRIVNQLAMFNEIEGFEVALEVYSTASEALATIGMKIPE